MRAKDSTGPGPRDSEFSAAERLDSWKEIASYLQRSVRTVQRWEQDENLPVRRLQHREQGSVYAFRPELDAWMQARESGSPPPLDARTGVGGGGAAASIAVLAFDNLGGDDEHDFLGTGIAEELTAALTGLEGLRVASRTSAFQLRGRELGAREIGRRLGVGNLLEGSVRVAGDRVGVTAQLIAARADDHVWSSSWEREMDDLLAVQDEIARGIADRLEVELGERLGVGSARGTRDATAHRAYLRGRHSWNQRTLAGFEAALRAFEEAIDADPGYARAWAGLADAHDMLGYYAHRPPREAFEAAREAARRALEFDPGLAEAHASLAFVRMFADRDFEAARQSFRKALDLRPDYAIARYWYGLDLAVLGRFFEAIEQVRRARELEPASPLVNAYVAGAYYFGRQFEQAEQRCRSALELDPGFFLTHLMLGWVLRELGRFDEALESLERARELSPESVDVRAHQGNTLAWAGERGEARSVLAELRERGEDRFVSAGHLGLVQLGLGEVEPAIDSLEEADEERWAWLIFLRVDPVFDPVRDEDRFEELQRRVLAGAEGGPI